MLPRLDSSGRFQGRPGFRASSAFDGTAAPWIGSWLDGRTAWLSWTTAVPVTLRRLRLAPPRERVRRPTLVRLRWDGHGSRPLEVARDGTVDLPTPAARQRFRLEILQAGFPAGATGAERQRRAVGIRELVGEGIPRVEVPRTGVLQGRCGDATATSARARCSCGRRGRGATSTRGIRCGCARAGSGSRCRAASSGSR